jgi:hypothetical protein
MSHVDILLDFSCFFYLEFFVKNVIRFFCLNGSLRGNRVGGLFKIYYRENSY